MSRTLLILGFVTSVAVHVLLLRLPARPAPLAPPNPPTSPAKPTVVPVVAMDPLRPDPAPAVRPEPEIPMPKAVEPAPAPKPKPASPPEPEPVAAKPPPVDSPPMEKTFEPEPAEEVGAGDLAGSTEGTKQPTLRIDWGNERDAFSVLDAGGMQVVILDTSSATPIITHEVARGDHGWGRRPYRPPAGTTRFSNRLRVVHDVPAFREIRRRARPVGSERLAVLVPVAVEQKLETARVQAAFTRGLTMQEITSFAGRFTVTEFGLAFEIVHVGGAR